MTGPHPLGGAPPVAGGLDVDLPGAGVRLRATRWPGAAGPPVLLLHGLASQRRFWDLVAVDLVAAGLPLVALDQRGHGDSPVPPDTDVALATVAADAVTALDALGLSRVVVVGHSYGAHVALTLAAAHPGRVLAVVAVDGGAGSPADLGPREEVRRALEPPRFAVPPDELPDRLRGGPLGAYWSDAVGRAVLPIFGVGEDGLARPRLPFDLHMRIVDTLLDYRADDVLPAVRCPAWLVSCERDGPGPAAADGWPGRRRAAYSRAGELLADGRVLRWGGALHDVPLQWPALVAGLVRAAVEEVSP